MIGANAASDEAVKNEQDKLEGTWVAVSREVNGKQASAEEIEASKAKLEFKGDKSTIRVDDKVVSEATFKLDPTKKPKAFDLTVTKGQNEGKKSLAIYELEGDTLKVCWTLFAVERARPTEFATKADSGLLLIVYKREKK